MRDITTADECRDVATEYCRLAQQSADPVRKSEYEVLARRWLKLAKKFETQERASNSNVVPFRSRRKAA